MDINLQNKIRPRRDYSFLDVFFISDAAELELNIRKCLF